MKGESRICIQYYEIYTASYVNLIKVTKPGLLQHKGVYWGEALCVKSTCLGVRVGAVRYD